MCRKYFWRGVLDIPYHVDIWERIFLDRLQYTVLLSKFQIYVSIKKMIQVWLRLTESDQIWPSIVKLANLCWCWCWWCQHRLGHAWRAKILSWGLTLPKIYRKREKMKLLLPKDFFAKLACRKFFEKLWHNQIERWKRVSQQWLVLTWGAMQSSWKNCDTIRLKDDRRWVSSDWCWHGGNGGLVTQYTNKFQWQVFFTFCCQTHFTDEIYHFLANYQDKYLTVLSQPPPMQMSQFGWQCE